MRFFFSSQFYFIFFSSLIENGHKLHSDWHGCYISVHMHTEFWILFNFCSFSFRIVSFLFPSSFVSFMVFLFYYYHFVFSMIILLYLESWLCLVFFFRAFWMNSDPTCTYKKMKCSRRLNCPQCILSVFFSLHRPFNPELWFCFKNCVSGAHKRKKNSIKFISVETMYDRALLGHWYQFCMHFQTLSISQFHMQWMSEPRLN